MSKDCGCCPCTKRVQDAPEVETISQYLDDEYSKTPDQTLTKAVVTDVVTEVGVLDVFGGPYGLAMLITW